MTVDRAAPAAQCTVESTGYCGPQARRLDRARPCVGSPELLPGRAQPGYLAPISLPLALDVSALPREKCALRAGARLPDISRRELELEKMWPTILGQGNPGARRPSSI